MSKKCPRYLLATLLTLSLITCSSTFGLATEKTEKQQFGKTAEEPTPKGGDIGPLKANICQNPKLCESIDIDMLSSLAAKQIPVFIPEPQPGKGDKEYQTALYLGGAVADALASIIGKDKPKFLKYAAMIQGYGKKLGVSGKALDKYKELTDAAGKDQWRKLEVLLYELKDEMVNELSGKNKKPLISLAMVSGGLEGLFLTAKSVDDKYSEEGAKLLNNKDLVGFCNNFLGALTSETKTQPEIKAISAALPNLEKMMAKLEANNYAQGDVKELYQALAALRKTIKGE